MGHVPDERPDAVAAALPLAHIAAMHDEPDADDRRMKIMEAVARSLLLKARYNGQTLTLAPHALFARHGELYVSALNLAKTWRSADERRLGYFKLAGLAAVELTGEPFEALSDRATLLPRADDELLLAVT